MAIMDSGSNYSFFEGVPRASVGRSAFDKSYINSFTALQGQIIPCYSEYTMLRDSYYISLQCVINVINPPKVQLLSRQRAFFHYYWLSFDKLWKQSHIFFSKGRTTSQYTAANNLTVEEITLSTWSRGSLADYLGFNIADTTGSSSFTFSALKFMAYLRIVRDRYLNQRLHCLYLENVADGTISDSELSAADAKLILDFMYPQDDADFRLGTPQWNALKASQTAIDYLFAEPWYRNFADDYFTTAQTTPIYQDEPEVPLKLSPSTLFLSPKFDEDDFTNSSVIADSGRNVTSYQRLASGSTSPFNLLTDSDSSLTDYQAYSRFVSSLSNSVGISTTPNSVSVSGLTINAIRSAESATIILEKMARCPNGTYGEFAQVMFGIEPASARDYSPIYIGGDYIPIVFTQVVNTAGSSGGNLQGDITGRGLAAGSGRVGHLESDDFGIILGVVSVMPDTYYKTGLLREDTYRVAEDFFLPDRAELGMQAILNKELWNKPSDSSNDDVFGYINRFDELRYRMNEVHGMVADDSSSRDISAMVQTRHFSSRPTLTPQFVTTKDNIDNNWLSVLNMPPYIIQVLNSVRAIRPIPYKAEPATFGM